MNNLEKYYNKFHEEHRLTTRHGQVEFRTTMHYIGEAVKMVSSTAETPVKIADIGAGTGRYSVELCHQCYDVTAVELVKHNLEILRSKHENIKTWQGDARDLHFFEAETFDVTLLFGPLYHLHGEENKLKALKEARRITKKGGIILAAYVMNEYSVISYCFKEHKWQEIMQKGGLSPDFHTICGEDDLYDYARIEDMDRLNAAAGLKRIKIISADGAADYMRRELNEMSEEEFEAFCNFQLAICEKPELAGAGSHCVDILKKE
ncbi:MAG: class I SAM-dependent methyltransferase [Treponema sp.]|nr:class I SAM-dependent methyltransferase [Treponema sp.]